MVATWKVARIRKDKLDLSVAAAGKAGAADRKTREEEERKALEKKQREEVEVSDSELLASFKASRVVFQLSNSQKD